MYEPRPGCWTLPHPKVAVSRAREARLRGPLGCRSSSIPATRRCDSPGSAERAPAGSRLGAVWTRRFRFCAASDGVRLAYAKHGRGSPLQKASNWLTHLEFDWESPVWRHWLEGLGRANTVIRYDLRGCGMSDREVGELSLERWVLDLGTVIDAAGVERCSLLGISGGAAIALAYAARNPGGARLYWAASGVVALTKAWTSAARRRSCSFGPRERDRHPSAPEGAGGAALQAAASSLVASFLGGRVIARNGLSRSRRLSDQRRGPFDAVSAKNVQIASVAEGPRGSVWDPPAAPPDHACPSPPISSSSCMSAPRSSVHRLRV
jgi:pimeloyl-ACP methyl ester carboxylesterase